MYFKDCTSIEELKKAYRKVCFKLHPDMGGNEDDFKKMNNEYENLLKKLGKAWNYSHIEQDETYDWTKDKFAEIIQKIIGFDINIEIIGSWIWCFDSFLYKDQLKELGFWFSGSKKAWVYSGEEKRKGRTRNKLEDIREKWGFEKVQTKKSL